jgi:D-alanine-D-alanine ligase
MISTVRAQAKPRIVVAFNRDFEGADSDPENKAREDIKDIALHVASILEAAGYQSCPVGVTDDVLAAMKTIKGHGPAAVFNLCESIQGDNRFEALVPLLLELAGISYTGSGPVALSLALHKDKAKELLRARGVPAARGLLVRTPADLDRFDLRFPVIVKPTREDASVGITSASVVHDSEALAARVLYVLTHYRQPALVEEYVEGREIYVSLLGRVGERPEIFPFFEIDFAEMPADRPRIVSFEAKWVEDSVEFRGTRPVRCEGLSTELRDRIAATARAAFEALELRDYARVDIRLAADGTPYVIDVNPNCDLSDLAGGFSKAAKAAGLAYEEVIVRIVELALSRRPQAETAPVAVRARGVTPLAAARRVVRARPPRRRVERA